MHNENLPESNQFDCEIIGKLLIIIIFYYYSSLSWLFSFTFLFPKAGFKIKSMEKRELLIFTKQILGLRCKF